MCIRDRLEALEKLGTPDPADATVANQIASTLRNIKVDLTFALGGLKNHELYFNILGGDGKIGGDVYKRQLRGFCRRFCRFCPSPWRGGLLVCFRIYGP